MDEKLKACPFCGSAGKIKHGLFGEVMGVCSNDGCKAGLGADCWQKDKTGAAAAWNRRAPDPLAERMAEALYQALKWHRDYPQCTCGDNPHPGILNFECSCGFSAKFKAMNAALAAWEGRGR